MLIRGTTISNAAPAFLLGARLAICLRGGGVNGKYRGLFVVQTDNYDSPVLSTTRQILRLGSWHGEERKWPRPLPSAA